MPQATFHFPRGFLWGTATASHQVEGNNTKNNWWTWEQQPGRIIQDDKSGLACDWWAGRWKEDFDRAKEAGQNAHRLSIEWSRIQPTPDYWDEGALDHYREIVRGLIERHMTPLVTLHHFTDPIWLAEMGGWENPEVKSYFNRFVAKVVEALKEYVTLWVTINEPNVLASEAYILGDWPPGKRDLRVSFKVMTHQVQAHAAAYHTIHKIQSQARVGIALQYRPFIPAKTWSPLDRWVSGLHTNVFNEFFPRALTTGVLRFPLYFKRVPEAKGTLDYLGINYYTQEQVAFDLLKPRDIFSRRFFPPGADLSDSGMIANEPAGMFTGLKWGSKFNLPVIITENGVDDASDRIRPRYLIQHLHQVWRAINFNFPVKGYFHWTLVDNFEWERGWTQRFGLWELDIENQTRKKRPSAGLYADICRTNGISSETVAQYAPEIFERLFPG